MITYQFCLRRALYSNLGNYNFMRRVLISLILVLLSIEGVACICIFKTGKKWQKEMIGRAAVIFVGTARLDASVQNVKFWGADSLVEIQNVVFEVNEGFKGLDGRKEIKLSPGGCGGGYKIGIRYLVFAFVDGNPRLLRADYCESYTESEHRGGTNIGLKYFKRLKVLIKREKKRLKF